MTSILMLSRVGLQGLFFLALVFMLSADQFGIYSTFLSLGLLAGTFASLGGNYLFASEVSKHGSNIQKISWPLVILNFALSSLFILIIIICINVLYLFYKFELRSWVIFLLIGEGVFGKSIEFMSIVKQADKKFTSSQFILAFPACLKLVLIFLCLITGERRVDFIVYYNLIANAVAWILVVYYLWKREYIVFSGIRKIYSVLREFHTAPSLIISQSVANGVLFFVGDGAKPLVALFTPPEVVGAYSAALRFFEVSMIPVKGYLFEVLHRWFDDSLSKMAERVKLARNILLRSLLSAFGYITAIILFGIIFGTKYPGFTQVWILLTPLIITRAASYSLGDALIAAGSPILRAICLLLVPVTISGVLAIVSAPGAISVATAMLIGEIVCVMSLILAFSLRRNVSAQGSGEI